jgi:hypothetical protein
MRPIAFSVLVTMGVVTIGVVSQAVAQEPPSHVLPEVIIGSKPAAGSGANTENGRGAHPGPGAGGGPGANGAPAAADRCAEGEAGSKAMDCLNQKLKQQVDRVNPSMNAPPLDAKSPDTKIGVVNIPGVKQQYGKNFGVSAVPYRPPPLNYGTSITHR